MLKPSEAEWKGPKTTLRSPFVRGCAYPFEKSIEKIFHHWIYIKVGVEKKKKESKSDRKLFKSFTPSPKREKIYPFPWSVQLIGQRLIDKIHSEIVLKGSGQRFARCPHIFSTSSSSFEQYKIRHQNGFSSFTRSQWNWLPICLAEYTKLPISFEWESIELWFKMNPIKINSSKIANNKKRAFHKWKWIYIKVNSEICWQLVVSAIGLGLKDLPR